jgi:hypothetical protein
MLTALIVVIWSMIGLVGLSLVVMSLQEARPLRHRPFL